MEMLRHAPGGGLRLSRKHMMVTGALLNKKSEFKKIKMKFVNFQLLFPAAVTIAIKYYDTLNHSTRPTISYFLVYHV